MTRKTYNTPKRKCVVKTRLTEDERRAFEDKCATLSMSQSEYIRQAVFYSRISPVIRVTAHSEEMLTAVSSLVAWWLNSFRLLLFVLSLIGEKQGVNRNCF